MKKLRLSELSEVIRTFVEHLLEGEGVEIEDDTGVTRGQFISFRDPTPEQEQRADASLAELRKSADASMKKYGKTEDDVMRVILEDD